jgi:hypothetical protein
VDGSSRITLSHPLRGGMHYLLFYDVVPDYLERRAPLTWDAPS